MINLIKLFVDKGIYKLFSISDSIFLCESLSSNVVGKMVRYRKLGSNCWERTNMSYFLTAYNADDVKSIFTIRDNYDMLGMIDSNFVFCEGRKFIKKMEI